MPLCVFERVCVAVQGVELAGEPTNHSIDPLLELYFACRTEMYLFNNLGVEFRAVPSIHPSIYPDCRIFQKTVADHIYSYT